jgi:hypothetical protein
VVGMHLTEPVPRVQNRTSGYGKLPNGGRQRGSVLRDDAPFAVYAASR